MTEILAHPTMGAFTDENEKESLLSRLDGLLEQYLNTIDQYQKAQQELSKQLSSAHMSLAHAQFNNSSHARYGQDYYDERMQASRKTAITERDSDITFSISHTTPVQDTKSSPDSERDTPRSSDEPPKDTSDASPELPSDPSNSGPSPSDGSPHLAPKHTDPLRWFGILVPPTLRAAQASFISVVEGPIPQLASLTKELRKLEIDIGRLRKQIKKLDRV